MNQAETEQREFKRGLAELKQGIVSLTAMLNKHGEAELWFGISPKGEAIGFDITEKTLRDVSQTIAAYVEPAIYPTISQEEVNGKQCIKVTALGQQQPYFAYGRAHMRVADEDKRLSAQELKQLILHKNSEAARWETETSHLTLEQLDSNKIQRFLERAGLTADTAQNALEKLELFQGCKLAKAADLFFTEQPIELRCAVFAGTNTGSTVIDMKDFNGDILQLIEEAEKYILKNINIGMRLEGLYRVDVPEIAVEAFREAIINAFCHRDWRDPENIRVAIFKDRVEIRSPGELYGNLTIERIRQGNVSRRRNPLIATLLRRVHLVEAWGRGMPKILDNAPNANFKEFAGLFVATFERPSNVDIEVIPHVTPHVTPHVKNLLLVMSGELLRQEILDLLGLSDRKNLAENYLTPAIEQGLVEMTLPDKPRSRLQKYRLTQLGQQLVASLEDKQ